MSNANSYVYVIGCPAPSIHPVKIGWTTNVETRLHQLRTDTTITPADIDRSALQVLYSCDGDRILERALHHRFRSLRVAGEWFRLNPAVAAREVRMAISEITPIGTPEHGDWRYRAAGRPRPKRTVAHTEPVTSTALALPDLVLTAATRHHELFTAWIKAGFTEEQALKMVAWMATGVA